MELNYRRYGLGEPLIILHGLFGMLDNWHSMAGYFSSFFEVFNIDLRNHGRSPHSDAHNYPVMARDIYELLQDQNIFNANILGHSMGGKTAMQFAAIYPGYVKKLVVVDIFPKTYKTEELGEQREVFRAVKTIADKSFTDRKSAEEELRNHIHDQRTCLFMFKNLVKNQDGTIGLKFNLKALTDNYRQLLENIIFTEPMKVPTLFVKGEKSGYITEEDMKGVDNYFSNATMETIPGAGHWVHADAPEAFKEVIMNFLKSEQ